MLFRFTSEIMNYDLLGGDRAQRKAFTYTGQHNTERLGQTSMF